MNRKFKTPLDRLCGNAKNSANTHYIYFKNGFIYVTNGNIALKQRMDLHGLTSKEIADIDGYTIHKDVFRLINRQDDVKIILNRSIPGDVYIEFEIGGGKFNVGLPRFIETPGVGKIIEQIDKSFDSFESMSTREIAINPEYITLLRKVMVSESSGFTFRFNTDTGGVLVTPNKNDYKEHAIITPLIVTGEEGRI